MMISTQSISVCSPRLPQPGICTNSPVALSPLRRQASLTWSSCFPKVGRGCSTLTAIKQASPFSSSAEDASADVKVRATNTGGRHSTGTQTVELLEPISPPKLASTIDDQLPTLLAMIIDGFPPFQMCKYVHEAENRLHQYVERYQNVKYLDAYYRAGLSAAAYGHPGTIDVDRLVGIGMNYGLQFLVDDLFFDTPSEFLQEQYGISRDARESPQKIREYIDHLDAIFGQQVQPSNPAPLIETIMWEAGQYTLGLSNPEWFEVYVADLVEHHRSGSASEVDILQGRNLYFQDLESYADMRGANVGGKFIQMMVEFGNDTYVPSVMRASPYFEKLTAVTSIHLGLVNDVFSYHKESALEQNPRNLITLLMEWEGKPFVETVYMAIDVVNTYARTIVDLEAEAWNSTLRNHLHEIIALIVGNVYFSIMDKRYRHPDSIFPELRDMNQSWKILPDAEGHVGL
uniref:Terpene synthase n=1 Tax=Pseudotaxiphyllum elegans TaxID=186706 RepID=A0A1J0CQ86_9BRYO|nr:terpene synthase 3 [Pseudotaxiphyllum elegans]